MHGLGPALEAVAIGTGEGPAFVPLARELRRGATNARCELVAEEGFEPFTIFFGKSLYLRNLLQISKVPVLPKMQGGAPSGKLRHQKRRFLARGRPQDSVLW